MDTHTHMLTDPRTSGWSNGRCIAEPTNRWTERQIDRGIDGQMDGETKMYVLEQTDG
jgi:hypothetical protein